MASILFYERKSKKARTDADDTNIKVTIEEENLPDNNKTVEQDHITIDLQDSAAETAPSDQAAEIAFKEQETPDPPSESSNAPGILYKDTADWFRSIIDADLVTAYVSQDSCNTAVTPVCTQSKESTNVHVEAPWLPAIGTDFLPAAEYCYDALQVCSETKYHKKDTMMKHLSSIGWKVEFQQTGPKPVFRYIAPNGKLYYNLRDAFKYNLNVQIQLGSSISEAYERKFVVLNELKSKNGAAESLSAHTERKFPSLFDMSEKMVNSSSQCAGTMPVNLPETESVVVLSLDPITKEGATTDACNSSDNPSQFSSCDGKEKSTDVDSFQCAAMMDLNLPAAELPPLENLVSDVELDCDNSSGYVFGRVDVADDGNVCEKLPMSNTSQEKIESVAPDSSQPVQTRDLNIADTYRPRGNRVFDGKPIDPVYCPQALTDWIIFKRGKGMSANHNEITPSAMSKKAKQHLIAVGWQLYHVDKTNGRRELRYTLPKVKTCSTLVDACEQEEKEMLNEKPQSTASCKEINDPPSVHQESGPDGRRDDRLKDICQTSVSRLQKRVREISEPSSVHYNPQTVLSCLIDNNVIFLGAKVYIKARQGSDRMVEGQVCLEGVKCKCCNQVYSLAKFEAHASTISHQPAANIILEDGLSLLECQKKLAQVFKKKISLENSRERIKQNQPCETNDHICSVCHYGGDLVLCDQCPSAFHLGCLGLNDLPNGQWFCPSCRCGICNGSDFNGYTEQFTESTVLYCDQCEREYHVGCIRQNRQMTLESLPKETWFCSEKCEQIFGDLRKLLGVPIPAGDDNLTWTIFKSSQSALQDYCKLTLALGAMHECFEPIKGSYNDNNDLIQDVIYNKWSELNRMNYWGFYTLLLEQDEQLVSVAAVRIYGDKVPEIPLICTRFKYRNQGMCHRLMNVLEKKLAELGVERLVLPAVPQVLDTWITKFGFSKITPEDRLKFLEYTFLDFQDTTMCHKFLGKSPNLLEKSRVVGQMQGFTRGKRRGPARRPRLHYLESLIPRGARRPRSSITSRRSTSNKVSKWLPSW